MLDRSRHFKKKSSARGKRESSGYVGDYTMTQKDVENGGTKFEDTVAQGGWQIDNHLPGGFWLKSQDGAHLQKRRLSEPYAFRILRCIRAMWTTLCAPDATSPPRTPRLRPPA